MLENPWVGRGSIIPVIVIDDVADAVPLASALVEGGLSVLEVTLRTEAALDAIEAMAAAVPEAVVGAGTLKLPEDAQRVKDAGGVFAVTPGYTQAMGAACRERDLDLLPGVATASELMLAYADNFRFMKFFPAVAAGGTNTLKAFAGPFPEVTFCPTGGITLATAPDFLALANVSVCGGSWLTPKNLIAEKDWAGITALAKECANL